MGLGGLHWDARIPARSVCVCARPNAGLPDAASSHACYDLPCQPCLHASRAAVTSHACRAGCDLPCLPCLQ